MLWFLKQERTAKLWKWHELITKNKEDIAGLMTLEMGKPIQESRGEVNYALSFIDWFAEEARRVYGDIIPSPFPNRRLLTLKQPVGVCALWAPVSTSCNIF